MEADLQSQVSQLRLSLQQVSHEAGAQPALGAQHFAGEAVLFAETRQTDPVQAEARTRYQAAIDPMLVGFAKTRAGLSAAHIALTEALTAAQDQPSALYCPRNPELLDWSSTCTLV